MSLDVHSFNTHIKSWAVYHQMCNTSASKSLLERLSHYWPSLERSWRLLKYHRKPAGGKAQRQTKPSRLDQFGAKPSCFLSLLERWPINTPCVYVHTRVQLHRPSRRGFVCLVVYYFIFCNARSLLVLDLSPVKLFHTVCVAWSRCEIGYPRLLSDATLPSFYASRQFTPLLGLVSCQTGNISRITNWDTFLRLSSTLRVSVWHAIGRIPNVQLSMQLRRVYSSESIVVVNLLRQDRALLKNPQPKGRRPDHRRVQSLLACMK